MSVVTADRSDAAATLDASAWSQVRVRLVAYAARRVPDRALAEDIVQDVLLRAAGQPAAWIEVRDPAAWLMRLTQRAVADHYRRTRPESPQGLMPEPARTEPLAQDVDTQQQDRRDVARCLAPLVGELSELDQESLRLVDQEGRPQVDVARALGLSTSGMKSRVQRARRRLRDAFLTCCQVELDSRGLPISCEPIQGPIPLALRKAPGNARAAAG